MAGLLDVLRGNQKKIISPFPTPKGTNQSQPLIPEEYKQAQRQKLMSLLSRARNPLGNIGQALQRGGGSSTPTPAPQIEGAASQGAKPEPAQAQEPSSKDRLIEVIGNYAPRSQRENLEEYYPAFGIIPSMYEAEETYGRPGLGSLLGLMAFNESTFGRGTPNIFGVKPGSKSKKFASPEEALKYQLSESVLAGGETPAMNLLAGEGEITEEDIRNLYTSYDPPGAYLDNLIEDYKYIMGL